MLGCNVQACTKMDETVEYTTAEESRDKSAPAPRELARMATVLMCCNELMVSHPQSKSSGALVLFFFICFILLVQHAKRN